ncbi:unnamed protein product, partial [Polarella glacialis]
DSELSRAAVAANDENLLQKYAKFASEGKKRAPGGTKRVFAPSSGPLSGEPLHSNRVPSAQYDADEFKVGLGGLKLQHHLATRVAAG